MSPTTTLDVAPFNEFGRNFYKVLSNTTEGNVVASPLSCMIALGMIYLGSQGQTRAEMSKALHLSQEQSEAASNYQALSSVLQGIKEVEMSFANKAFVSEDFNILPAYLSVLKKSFETTAENINFTDKNSISIVNDWVKEATKGKIEKLFNEDFESDTKLVLINAIYFKGQWVSRFKKENTALAPFYVQPEKPVEVPMMHQKGQFLFAKLDYYDAQIVVLPYMGKDVNMVVFLPNKRDGLESMEQKLGPQDLRDVMKIATPAYLDLYLPKFKIETFLDLKPQLIEMGLGSIFSEQHANFSGISEAADLVVSKILQKAIIEVNEEGTVASVVTGAVMVTRFGAEEPIIKFRCDHPFLYFLTYRDSFSLFGGRVANPAEN